MTHKPPSVEYGFRQEWSTAEDFVRYNHQRENQKVIHLVEGKPTSDGVVYSGVTSWSTGSSKSSNILTVGASGGTTYSLAWPGLEGFTVEEMEVGLTFEGKNTTGKTTIGYSWQYKNTTGTTAQWTSMTTWGKTLACATTNTYSAKTVSHNKVSLGSGYNKLPMELRLRAYSKSAKGRGRIKSSSYVAIKAKKST